MKEEQMKKLEQIFQLVKELANESNCQLDGDMQIVQAILADKLRYLDQESYYKHAT